VSVGVGAWVFVCRRWTRWEEKKKRKKGTHSLTPKQIERERRREGIGGGGGLGERERGEEREREREREGRHEPGQGDSREA
jgi:hypothetical protein